MVRVATNHDKGARTKGVNGVREWDVVRGYTNQGSKVETPSSFNIGGREIIVPISVEATGGIRLKLKMPKIFQ